MEREKMERGKSELRMAIDDLCLPSSGDGEYQEQQGKVRRPSTMDLLCVSNQLLRVLDAIGPTLLVLRQDIQQNVQRLQDLHARDTSKYAGLMEIVMEEMEEGTSKKTNSCTRAIIWLASLQEMVEEAYESTLKPFHGWISSAAYRVALRLIPERDIFIELLMGNCQNTGDFGEDVMILVSIVQPLLEEINVIYRCLLAQGGLAQLLTDPIAFFQKTYKDPIAF
ncbi:hypothetical protein CFC21_068702 [Triticum aestivum]|uniref:Glycolipid transfer protein domain-containing protein n=2 Tax=Triticum aestivum TaxID=4565 RepID=A0A3B6KSP1_WHEAT|nr:hypothetical protein CFC21_068702 [Triticum aestivum]